MIFEKYSKDGTFIWYGKILAAEYRNEKRTHQAIYYQDSECREDYFTPSGRSLRRSFMRSPLRFTRISSGYSRRRLHPILRTYRPHLGVDFAAPTGTPVWAVADGVVAYKGWKNGNGNTVSIRHPNGYETMYNHLSRYGKGIKRGKHVRQKYIIGYVGSTGLSTGPHLDYRMKKNGRFINPLKEKFPLGTPVPAASEEAFQQISKRMLALLGDDYATGVLVAGMSSEGESGLGGQGSGTSAHR
jgi:murein DD-endopeptidase MepM/ murein hydrolase activator NlpD